MNSETCPFCVELLTPLKSIWNNKKGNLPLNRIIFENEHWVVMPPLGSFVVGGLLVLTKEHYQSCAVCPKDVLVSLERILSRIQVVLKEVYNKDALLFEHGPSSCGTKGACCVDHAHINIFPVDFDIWSQLPDFPTKIAIKHSTDILQLSGQEYIWLFDSQYNYAYPVSGVPSQYIRSLITKNYGFPERWNWQDYLGLDEIQKTMSDLKGKWSC